MRDRDSVCHIDEMTDVAQKFLAQKRQRVVEFSSWICVGISAALIQVWLFPHSWDALAGLVPVLAIVRDDIRFRLVDDRWLLCLSLLALFSAIVLAPEPAELIVSSLLRASFLLLAVAVMESCVQQFSGLRHSPMLGGGDLGVLGVSALWLPVEPLLAAISASCLAALILALMRRRRLSAVLFTELPYAALLAPTAYMMLVYSRSSVS